MAVPFKLYYTTTSCGAANYIVASLGKLDFQSEQVDIRSKKTASGADYLAINPKGNVPAIQFTADESRPILNENAATLTFLADQAAGSGLAPAEGTPARYEYLNALGFVNSELHPRVGALFNPTLSDDAKAAAKAAAVKTIGRFQDLVLCGKDYTTSGSTPTAADIYAYIVLSWCGYLGIDYSEHAAVAAFFARVAAYPGVKEAHDAMNAAAKN